MFVPAGLKNARRWLPYSKSRSVYSMPCFFKNNSSSSLKVVFRWCPAWPFPHSAFPVRRRAGHSSPCNQPDPPAPLQNSNIFSPLRHFRPSLDLQNPTKKFSPSQICQPPGTIRMTVLTDFLGGWKLRGRWRRNF